MKIMATSFKRFHAALLHSVPPTPQQATVNPHLHQRLLDAHGQVWITLWGHCSFLLGPGAHKVLFVPFKSPFPQSCVSSGGSMVGMMVTFSKRSSAIPAAGPCGRPLLTCTFPGDTQSQFWLSLYGSWYTQGLFEPSETLWRLRVLSLNAILPLLPSCWGFCFVLGRGWCDPTFSSNSLLNN